MYMNVIMERLRGFSCFTLIKVYKSIGFLDTLIIPAGLFD